jgi:hypothetical protein
MASSARRRYRQPATANARSGTRAACRTPLLLHSSRFAFRQYLDSPTADQSTLARETRITRVPTARGAERCYPSAPAHVCNGSPTVHTGRRPTSDAVLHVDIDRNHHAPILNCPSYIQFAVPRPHIGRCRLYHHHSCADPACGRRGVRAPSAPARDVPCPDSWPNWEHVRNCHCRSHALIKPPSESRAYCSLLTVILGPTRSRLPRTRPSFGRAISHY